MKIGTRVMTPDGIGKIIEPIGKPPDPSKPILIKLNKWIGMYRNFYYSESEIKPLTKL
jgi:hypothetical protein